MLCGYQQKLRIKEEIKDLTAWLTVNKSRVLSQINSGLVVDEQKVIASNLAANNRLDELNKELQEIESKPDKKIAASDVIEMFKFLKEKVTRKEVEEMIWEVDENLDEYVDWQEFRLMFNRNIMDRSGLEPSRLVSGSSVRCNRNSSSACRHLFPTVQSHAVFDLRYELQWTRVSGRDDEPPLCAVVSLT